MYITKLFNFIKNSNDRRCSLIKCQNEVYITEITKEYKAQYCDRNFDYVRSFNC